MSEYKYKYKSPLEKDGYKQVLLSKEQFKKLTKKWKNIETGWKTKWEFYESPSGGLTCHQFTSKLLIIFITILYPVEVLFAGLGNISETNKTYKKFYNEKEYGSFVEFHIPDYKDKLN